jgi:hypothetical protein
MLLRTVCGVVCLLAATLMGVANVSAAEKFDTDPKNQLPKPDGKPADMTKPVKVFILAGQSNMEGPAKVETFDYIGDDTSFKSQSGYILTITGNNGSTYINISDRWKGGNTEAGSTYPWLPLQINGSTMLLQWYDRWYLDLEAGTWSATKP